MSAPVISSVIPVSIYPILLLNEGFYQMCERLEPSFNISHIVIKPTLSMYPSSLSIVSIYPILLLNPFPVRDFARTGSFNISHIVIKRCGAKGTSLNQMSFNISHIVIKLIIPIGISRPVPCFNISHIVIKRLFLRRANWKQRVSIYPILLLNAGNY